MPCKSEQFGVPGMLDEDLDVVVFQPSQFSIDLVRSCASAMFNTAITLPPLLMVEYRNAKMEKHAPVMPMYRPASGP